MGKADTHVHTQYSGYSRLGIMKFPESVTSPETQVDNARNRGYDVLAITDHDETAAGFIAQKYDKRFDDIEVIVGEEVTTRDGEIIGLFLTERVPDNLSVEETVDIIRSQGGLTIAPHPFSFHVPGLKEKIFELDLDGFETINGGHPDKYSNHFAQMVMDRYPGRWAALSGSDAHSVYTSGYNWTEFDGTTADEFRKAILNKTTRPMGRAAPVFTQVQWSAEVVIGGQRLLAKSLKGELETVENDHLLEKIESLPR
ncbi:MAG: PHP domain-containing protein, partial [Candidatus Methanomethylophilaceae archaeon]|nr:PHP domain-containing protein [Candidatus Methanomethylophilaceae archaeon]